MRQRTILGWVPTVPNAVKNEDARVVSFPVLTAAMGTIPIFWHTHGPLSASDRPLNLLLVMPRFPWPHIMIRLLCVVTCAVSLLIITLTLFL